MNTSLAIFESFHDEKSTGRTALQLPVIHLNQLPRDHLSKPVAKPEGICQNNGNVVPHLVYMRFVQQSPS